MGKHDKAVSRDPADDLIFAEGFSYRIHPEFQKRIAGIHAQAVVDVFEVLDVDIGKHIAGFRMGFQKLFRSPSEPVEAQCPGQRIMIGQKPDLLFVFAPLCPLPHHRDRGQGAD